jgi:UDP-N-acetylglucosamine--N-acetylmuramyl-(pentapeptide) pyrophosphoryl-undecaprenol N-acetylglucosamine transferase
LTGDRLAARITALIADPERLTAMAAAARQLAKPRAAEDIVDRALALMK